MGKSKKKQTEDPENAEEDTVSAKPSKKKPRAPENGEDTVSVKPSKKKPRAPENGEDTVSVKPSKKKPRAPENAEDTVSVKPSKKKARAPESGEDTVSAKPSKKKAKQRKQLEGESTMETEEKAKGEDGNAMGQPEVKHSTSLQAIQSQLRRRKKNEKADKLIPIVGVADRTGSITKMKEKTLGLGLQMQKQPKPQESTIRRLSVKKPPGNIIPTTDSTSIATAPPKFKIEHKSFGAARKAASDTSLESNKSGGSHGSAGNNTPDDQYYDTEEMRVLNHQKMVHLTNKKTNPFVLKWKKWIAGMDTFAAKHSIVFHNMCIKISLFMIPILLASLIWDSIAGFFLEIPHWSMIDLPGCMLVFHFISLPLVMYGYMMRSLMGKGRTCLSRWAVVAIIIHPVLLGYRCFLEFWFDQFRNEEKIRYEYFEKHDVKESDKTWLQKLRTTIKS